MKVLNAKEIKTNLMRTPGWTLRRGKIVRDFLFHDYRETLCFVNGAARIAEEHDHHPRIDFSYKNCKITYQTHNPKGLTLKDFLCARAVNELFRKSENKRSPVLKGRKGCE